VDSRGDSPNIDPEKVRSAITNKTKAVVFMSYAGQAEGIEEIKQVCEENNLWLIEDAAHSFDAKHEGNFIGSYGHVAAFSFHETKTVHCGQGGMLLINDARLVKRAKTVEAHGSNKVDFERGRVSEYNWTSLGGEFNLAELNAAFLYKQFQYSDYNKKARRRLWYHYYQSLKEICHDRFKLPLTDFDESNFYIFYIVLDCKENRDKLIAFLKSRGIHANFHYTALNESEFYRANYQNMRLENSEMFSQCLLRLPLYVDMDLNSIEAITCSLEMYYSNSYHETLV
jgi:dTDP-4-amino-4,6-dideoxygalactose transaminase